ncbi:hypothetical protein L209DRAFT_64669 [Thermothelomyces heterothallicus CBS 203.75]
MQSQPGGGGLPGLGSTWAVPLFVISRGSNPCHAAGIAPYRSSQGDCPARGRSDVLSSCTRASWGYKKADGARGSKLILLMKYKYRFLRYDCCMDYSVAAHAIPSCATCPSTPHNTDLRYQMLAWCGFCGMECLKSSLPRIWTAVPNLNLTEPTVV